MSFSKSTWNGPASNDASTITFRQHIGAIGRAAHGCVQQDAHVHALDDESLDPVVVIAAAAALSSCGGGASGPAVAVVAPDGVLRALGEPCSGGEPFLYAHATAAFRIEDAAGKVVSRGRPAGGQGDRGLQP